MAQKRMFSLKVIDTDKFIELSDSEQLLYFYFGMFADDEGVVSNIKRILRTIAKTENDVKSLEDAGLIFTFESGVAVIVDWKIHNTIAPTRMNKSIYQKELSELELDGMQYLRTCDDKMLAKCQQTADTVLVLVSGIVKVQISLVQLRYASVMRERHAFRVFIANNKLSNIMSMRDQLTNKECLTLEKKYGLNLMQTEIIKMDANKKACKRLNVKKTFGNWLLSCQRDMTAANIAKPVIEHMNQISGTKFDYQEHWICKYFIPLSEKFSVDDMKKAVDNKYAECKSSGQMNWFDPGFIFSEGNFQRCLNKQGNETKGLFSPVCLPTEEQAKRFEKEQINRKNF